MLSSTPRKKALVLTLAFEGSLGIIALVLGIFFSQPLLKRISITPTDFWYGCLATIPPLIVFFILVHLPWAPFLKIRTFLEKQLLPFFHQCRYSDLFWISLLAGLGEELLFRGIIQELLETWLGFPWGWVMASFLFGLGHLITFTYAVCAMAIGLYLGWLWNFSGNLFIPIFTHALYDFFALVFFIKWFPPSSQPFPPQDAGPIDNPTES